MLAANGAWQMDITQMESALAACNDEAIDFDRAAGLQSLRRRSHYDVTITSISASGSFRHAPPCCSCLDALPFGRAASGG